MWIIRTGGFPYPMKFCTLSAALAAAALIMAGTARGSAWQNGQRLAGPAATEPSPAPTEPAALDDSRGSRRLVCMEKKMQDTC